MGKNDMTRVLINSISLVSYHKILYEKGDKIESKKHLQDEIRGYSTDGFEKAQSCKLSKEELAEVQEKSIKRTSTILKNKYPDISFSENEIKEKVVDTMQEFLLM